MARMSTTTVPAAMPITRGTSSVSPSPPPLSSLNATDDASIPVGRGGGAGGDVGGGDGLSYTTTCSDWLSSHVSLPPFLPTGNAAALESHSRERSTVGLW